ncbi:MAG: hypothetical protein ACI9NI_000288 [Olleya marilimosa]|jgi:hypothetical protein|nr:hypothetical protein JM82_0635 [Olleya sp. Hel_I_94]
MQDQPKYQWKPLYTILLVANALYIIAFYLITKLF